VERMRRARAVALAALVWIPAGAARPDVRVIAVDPGHGGVDHGARSAKGLLEKDVALGVSLALADELRQHVKLHLAPYKFPRWVEFLDELPKTATGKIQRFKLRARVSP